MSLTRVASALVLFMAVAVLPAQIGNFPQSEATSINNSRQIAGWTLDSAGTMHAWVWDGGFAINLETLPQSSDAATAINNVGLVVGYKTLNIGTFQAVLWNNRVPQDLVIFGGLPTTSSRATAVNSNGIVVGWASYDFTLTQRAFMWDGSLRDLGPLVGDFTAATAINDRGDIVGTKVRAWGFLLRNGIVTQLSSPTYSITAPAGINEKGQIALTAFKPPALYAQAVLWDRGVFQELGTLGGAESEATAINRSAQIVGGSRLANGRVHAFLWQKGVMQDLDTLGGENSMALAINDFGDVVGRAETPAGSPHAFLWRNGAMIDLGIFVGP